MHCCNILNPPFSQAPRVQQGLLKPATHFSRQCRPASSPSSQPHHLCNGKHMTQKHMENPAPTSSSIYQLLTAEFALNAKGTRQEAGWFTVSRLTGGCCHKVWSAYAMLQGW
jgi:hypothetical protein